MRVMVAAVTSTTGFGNMCKVLTGRVVYGISLKRSAIRWGVWSSIGLVLALAAISVSLTEYGDNDGFLL
jgi:hypothetical protein